MDGFEEKFAGCAARVNARMTYRLSSSRMPNVPPRLLAAMRHAVLGGGKRFRPFLTLETGCLFGIEVEAGLDAAVAIEYLHCYSLVHDDLPAMDNDEMRRGAPSVWKAFDEATAILAGDALLTLAFEIMGAETTHPDPAVRAELVTGLARAAGAAGMVGGQQLDLEAEEGQSSPLHTFEGVVAIQTRKTGALIRFAAEAGAILGQASETGRQALVAYGDALGTAFQIADDLLDAEGDAATLGKAVGKDAAAGKATFVSILGAEGAKARLAAVERQAVQALGAFGHAADSLRDAVHFVVSRTS